MKKLVSSILILAVGLSIISGVVIAKTQFTSRVIAAANPPAAETVIGDALTSTSTQAGFAQAVFASEAAKPTRFEGSVSAVDRNDALFDLNLVGSDLTAFHVDSLTEYQGSLSSFQDLSAEMSVSLMAVRGADGGWHVLSILSQSPVSQPTTGQTESSPEQENVNSTKVNVGGRVTNVGADTLTIQTQGGTPITFAITAETIISSYIGGHDSLDDIQVNFTVAVIYFEDAMLNGLRVASRVVVANEGIAFNANAQGWVDSASASQLTMTTNQGTTYTFTVDGSTQVRGVGSASEIGPGMRVFVYYQDTGSGLLAKGIQVWP
jgi:hypothetical protein